MFSHMTESLFSTTEKKTGVHSCLFVAIHKILSCSALFYVDLIQARVACEEVLSTEKMSPPDWPTSWFVGAFSWLIWDGPGIVFEKVDWTRHGKIASK